MGDRCTGNCCESFVINHIGDTPEKIDAYLRTRAVDGVQIADMLVPIRKVEPGAVMPDGSLAEHEPQGGGWVFTCKHFDTGVRNCGIYATRPAMCRDFPYGKPCEHGDRCGWDRGRNGKHPPKPAHYKLWAATEIPNEPGAEPDRSSMALEGDAAARHGASARAPRRPGSPSPTRRARRGASAGTTISQS